MSGLSDLFAVIINGGWALLNIKVPGFNFTFAHMLLGTILATAALGLIGSLLGIGIGGVGKGSKQKGGNNKNIKIAKERKGDTK